MNLTVEDRLALRAALTRTPPNLLDAHLIDYTNELFQVRGQGIPSVAVVPGHSTPADHLGAMWRGETSITLASRGSFKALSLGTPLVTPDGWTTMGETKVGDVLYDEAGEPCSVIGVSDIFRERPCYAVVFTGDIRIVADEDHLWAVFRKDISGHTDVVQMTTGELNYAMLEGYEFSIPTPRALRCPEINLDIHPYLLGASIGTGELHEIPKIYLRASEDQRVSLLQGVIDADQSISAGGGVTAHVAPNRKLRDSFTELLHTLGYMTFSSFTQDKLGEHWNTHFSVRGDFFHRADAPSVRQITAVSPVESVPTKCVTVDSPSHLYLAGHAMVPTHNSLTASIGEFMLAHFRGDRVLHYAASEKQVDEVARYCHSFAGFPWWEPHVNATQNILSFNSGGSIEFRVLTRQTARGAHAPVLVFDEADEMNPKLLDVVSMSVGSADLDAPIRYHYISTKNHPFGIVHQLMEKAKQAGTKTLQWNYLDITERCPPERSGTNGELCMSCPLVTSCQGRLRQAHGTLPIETVMAVWDQIGHKPAQWNSQMLNEEPSTESLIVPEFSLDQVTKAAEFTKGHPWYIGIDFGTNHPGAIVAVQRFQNRRKHIFDEEVAPASFVPHFTRFIEEHWIPKYGYPSTLFADPSGIPALGECILGDRKYTLEKAENNHKIGYGELRAHCSIDGDGLHRMLVHPRCAQLVHELRSVAYKTKPDGTVSNIPEKINDDCFDAARYVVVELSKMDGRSHAEEMADIIEKQDFQRLKRTILWRIPL